MSTGSLEQNRNNVEINNLCILDDNNVSKNLGRNTSRNCNNRHIVNNEMNINQNYVSRKNEFPNVRIRKKLRQQTNERKNLLVGTAADYP